MTNRNELLQQAQDLTLKQRDGWITLEREYSLLTPLFGGGVTPGENDSLTPIRGTEIRGHLRFWWRATRGGQFGTIDALRDREEKIWGSASVSSLVTLVITQQSRGTAVSSVKIQTRNGPKDVGYGAPQSPYGYVAFPLRQEGAVLEGVSFTLRLTFPQTMADDVRAALWAWDSFGGIGARTRRGFGALNCKKCDNITGNENAQDWLWFYDCDSILEQLQKDLEKYVVEGKFPENVPHLRRDNCRNWMKITGAKQRADEVWKYLFGKMKDFRQSRFPGQQANRPGRSHWPEPDEIRRLTGQSLPGHTKPTYSPSLRKFPRAQFGLPIIFEFKREDSHPTRSDRDPKKSSLEGVEHSRVASPLILRPLACTDGQIIQYAGLACILETDRIPPSGLALKNAQTKALIASGLDSQLDPTTTPSEPAQIQTNHPDYNGNPDILQAFLDTL